ncbi:hypothetical protein [Coralloluteibacterium thermophilus]|uniref:Uncharacterized protein n=1 Tax=Coralloluteibacterium thermophilum TaxID=2707049 RepID=A0ABV9NMN9_9GAMM
MSLASLLHGAIAIGLVLIVIGVGLRGRDTGTVLAGIGLFCAVVAGAARLLQAFG